MATIDPPGNSCISRPRSATKAKPSSSENTPERQAAKYSPMLCPIIACGRMPQLIHNWASEYSTANSAGCVMRVWLSRWAALSSGIPVA